MTHFVIQTDGDHGVLLVDGEQPKLFGELVGAEIRRPSPLGYHVIDPSPFSVRAREQTVVTVTLRLPIGPGHTLTLVQGNSIEDVQGPTADYVPDEPGSGTGVDFVKFLTARLDEDEDVARLAAPSNGDGTLYHPVWIYDREHFRVIVEDGAQVRFDRTTDVDGTHAARHDPARVLAEVKAKRAILALHAPIEIECSDVAGDAWSGSACYACEGGEGWPCTTLRHLAAVDADHPDYKQEWGIDA